MMRDNDFGNDATREEKVEQLRNEAALRAGDRPPTTLHALAGVDAMLESGGRFKSEVVIVGATETPAYPAAASHWSGNQVGLEAPTGIAINDLAPTGEAFEIERSLAEFADDAKSAGPLAPVQGHVEEILLKTSSAIQFAPSPAAPVTSADGKEAVVIASPAVSERGDGAIPPAAQAKLKALLGRGIRKRGL